MARSIQTIIDGMDAEQAAQTDLSGLNSTSNSAIYTLWKYIVATQMYLQEVLWDIFKKDLETIVDKAPVGSDKWLHSRVLKFQYSSITPQTVEVLDDFSVGYATEDTTLRIITRAAVRTVATRTVNVKVAKEKPPVALTPTELAALQSYLNNAGDGTYAGRGVGIGFAGVRYVASSLDADKLYLGATIYYNGQYTNVISDNVITAINTYLANIQFDGTFKLTSLVDAIQSVTGVTDVVLENVAIRSDTEVIANSTYLVQAKTTIIPTYQLTAGYVVEEDTTNYLFTDTLTFVAQ